MDFWDDVKGGPLERERVIEARKLEMAYFRKMCVYTKVPLGEAKALGAKVISTKWVDTNKGSEGEPNYRSRLVGRELNLSDRPDLFAATPSKASGMWSAGVPRLSAGNGPIGYCQSMSAGRTSMLNR